MTNCLEPNSNDLGAFLKDRRLRLDASALGFGGRRRTPGLRREEVAQRANISTTWYTWLEQGRGGAPSARVLESLAKALMLTEAERQYLFLVAIGHPPKAQSSAQGGISRRLQRFLDAMPMIPAIVATSTWDVVAWNHATQLALTDYETLPLDDRNIMKLMFLDPAMRAAQSDWEAVARFLVATFRAETTRIGEEDQRSKELVADIASKSNEFTHMWRENDVHIAGEGSKTILHPTVGGITFEFSSFTINGRPDLKLMIYNPADFDDLEKMELLLSAHQVKIL